MVEQRLVLEDRDARLEVRCLDVGDQAALEARAQAVFELLDFARRAVGRQDDLLVGDVQGVEGVEEFFLRALLAGEELDIVDHQDVDGPVLLAEELGLAFLDGADDLVGELLTRDIEHAHLGVVLQHAVADGVHEVGLAEADAAVHEERVVDFARRFGDGHGRRMGKAVRAAGHEGLEGVLRVQRRAVAWRDDVHVAVVDGCGRLLLEERPLIGVFLLAAAVAGCFFCLFRVFGAVGVVFRLGGLGFGLGLHGRQDQEVHLALAAEHGADRILDDREVVAGDPVLDEVVLRAEDKSRGGQGDGLDRFEPLEG